MAGLVGGRYRLDTVIGSGGMGSVWRGFDEMLHRTVAVKEIRFPAQLSEAERAEVTSRAFAEARSAARLEHPNIVPVYDVVEHGGRPWIVMRLVEGRSLLDHVVRSGPLPAPEAARIGLAVLDALAVAHAAGIVHRDVKPSNLLVQPAGTVLLTDVSIASTVGAGTRTNAGVVLGSPGFIAPERVAGERAGPPADLFGLGATLFFLVEGFPPFHRDDALASIFASANHPHPRPRNAGPLTAVIDGLLAKDPSQRLSAPAARSALAAVRQAGLPGTVPPRRPSGPPPADPPTHRLAPRDGRRTARARRYRVSWVAGLAAVAALLLGGGLYLGLRPTGSAEPSGLTAATPSATTSAEASVTTSTTGSATVSVAPASATGTLVTEPVATPRVTSVSIEQTGSPDGGCGGTSLEYGFLIHVTVNQPVTTIFYEVTILPDDGSPQKVHSGQIRRFAPAPPTSDFTIQYVFTDTVADQPYFQIEARVWVPDVTDSSNSGTAPGPVDNPCL